ncbi:MAG: hypothetical protein U0412_13710 [Nitrospira sp.]
MPLPISYAILLLLTAYLGVYVGIYSWSVVWLREFLPRYGIFSPRGCCCLELTRTYFLSGLPWCLLGYSQYRNLEVIQVADHLGVYGVSFLIILHVNPQARKFCCGSCRSLEGSVEELPWELALITSLLMGLTWIYGAALLDPAIISGRENVRAEWGWSSRVDQAVKWDPTFRDKTMQRFDRLMVRDRCRSGDLARSGHALPFRTGKGISTAIDGLGRSRQRRRSSSEVPRCGSIPTGGRIC